MPPSQSGLSVRDIAAMIDHTLLKPQATDTDIRRLCQEARQYQFVAVCVNPYWVPLADRRCAWRLWLDSRWERTRPKSK